MYICRKPGGGFVGLGGSGETDRRWVIRGLSLERVGFAFLGRTGEKKQVDRGDATIYEPQAGKGFFRWLELSRKARQKKKKINGGRVED